MNIHPTTLVGRVALSGILVLGAVLGLTGCANLIHKGELQTAARQALADYGLTAGAEAFDTGEGFADRYNLLVCAVVPPGQEYDDLAIAGVLVDALNAVREGAEQDGRVHTVSIRLTDSNAEQDSLNNWCRKDTRILGIDDNVLDLISVTPDRSGWKSVDFAVPYAEAELRSP